MPKFGKVVTLDFAKEVYCRITASVDQNGTQPIAHQSVIHQTPAVWLHFSVVNNGPEFAPHVWVVRNAYRGDSMGGQIIYPFPQKSISLDPGEVHKYPSKKIACPLNNNWFIGAEETASSLAIDRTNTFAFSLTRARIHFGVVNLRG